LTSLVHPFCYASRYNNMSRYIVKWMKKIKTTYNLERRQYMVVKMNKYSVAFFFKQKETIKTF
jgi:hypothetical protein